MFPSDLRTDRMVDAGADVQRIRQASILIKVGDVFADDLRCHPLWPLVRGFRAIGVPQIHLRGAIEYFDALSTPDFEEFLDQEPGIWLDAGMASLAPRVDVMVDLSNDERSRVICDRLASDRRCPSLWLQWGDGWCGVGSKVECLTGLPTSFSGLPCPAISRIVAGLALQEAMICMGAVPSAAPLEKCAVYDARTGDASRSTVNYCWSPSPVRDAVIDVVGAGGIGVHLLESLVPLLGMGCSVRIFDPDHVGEENLGIQFAYSERDVGAYKAEVMAESLIRYRTADVELQAFPMRYQEKPGTLDCPDIRVLCPDNFVVRHYANNLSLSDRIPIVEAGSSPLAAQQRTYLPGYTACLEHRIRDLGTKAATERATMSCSRSTAPTLPGTNAIIGGVLAMETLSALRPHVCGYPSKATWTYDCRFPDRFGLVDERPPCKHEPADGVL